MAEPDTVRSKDELLADLGHDELPKGWKGGESRHTGGNLWLREFVNESEQVRVVYSLEESEPGVGLDSVQWDEELETWIPQNTLAEKSAPETDEEKFAAAIDLMQNFEKYR